MRERSSRYLRRCRLQQKNREEVRESDEALHREPRRVITPLVRTGESLNHSARAARRLRSCLSGALSRCARAAGMGSARANLLEDTVDY